MRFYSAECAMTLTGALMMRASFRSISEPILMKRPRPRPGACPRRMLSNRHVDPPHDLLVAGSGRSAMVPLPLEWLPGSARSE